MPGIQNINTQAVYRRAEERQLKNRAEQELIRVRVCRCVLHLMTTKHKTSLKKAESNSFKSI